PGTFAWFLVPVDLDEKTNKIAVIQNFFGVPCFKGIAKILQVKSPTRLQSFEKTYGIKNEIASYTAAHSFIQRIPVCSQSILNAFLIFFPASRYALGHKYAKRVKSLRDFRI